MSFTSTRRAARPTPQPACARAGCAHRVIRWHRWLKGTPEGRELRRRWQEWIATQARRYEWDIQAEDSENPTIHGLRRTGILARFEAGFEVDQIANDIGMSRQMIERYMRFKDQMQVGAGGAARLRLVEGKG